MSEKNTTEKNNNIWFSKAKIKITNKHPLQSFTKNSINSNSKQAINKDKNSDGVLEPQIWFPLLRKTIQSWSILSWIVNKIASSCDTGFIPTENTELDLLLSKFDVYETIRNLSIFWNVFLEKIKNVWGGLHSLDIILTETCKLKDWWEDWLQLLQQYWTEKVPFAKEEFIQLKRWSLTNKYYWDSIFSECIDSILLLYFIDLVYKKLFENGFIEPSLLVDEDAVLSQDQKDAITWFIKDYFKWIDNGFEVWIISGKVKRLELTSKLDHNSFISLKKEAKEELAIALNIPYDLLSWKNSNRATRESSFEDFNLTLIKPIQKRFINQLKEWLRAEFWYNVDKIELNPVDTKNQLEESQVVNTLIRCWVFSIDMWLDFLWYESTGIAENQIHKVYWWWGGNTSDNTQNQDQAEIQEQVKKMYNTKLWKN